MLRADRPCGEGNALKGIERCNCMQIPKGTYKISRCKIQAYIWYTCIECLCICWSPELRNVYVKRMIIMVIFVLRTCDGLYHINIMGAVQHVLSTGLHWLILPPELDVVLEGQHGKNLRRGKTCRCCWVAVALVATVLHVDIRGGWEKTPSRCEHLQHADFLPLHWLSFHPVLRHAIPTMEFHDHFAFKAFNYHLLYQIIQNHPNMLKLVWNVWTLIYCHPTLEIPKHSVGYHTCPYSLYKFYT